jgi:hypothetical protein
MVLLLEICKKILFKAEMVDELYVFFEIDEMEFQIL